MIGFAYRALKKDIYATFLKQAFMYLTLENI